MLIEYTGKNELSFTKGSIYEARKVDDVMEGYSIFDEGDDWYWYSKEFVKQNFKICTQKDFKSAD